MKFGNCGSLTKLGAAGLACTLLLACVAAGATTYYVANDGDDDNIGATPEQPWQTLDRLNGRPFIPGDRILFRRGDVWRGQLAPSSGDAGTYVTYGAYGTGGKPLLLGSVEKNRPDQWVDEGNNIWATLPPASAGTELLAGDAYIWHFHSEGAAVARAMVVREEGEDPRGYRVECTNQGEAASEIQVYTGRFAVNRGKLYRLTFRAKCTKPFEMQAPKLMQSCPPWIPYGSSTNGDNVKIAREWQTNSFFYRAGVSAPDARITFFLGGSVPNGAVFQIDSLSFMECGDNGVLTSDVGNIIFNGEESCGVKVWNEADLDAQGKYWYDEDAHVLKLYSTECPATFYSDIECALRNHIIDQGSRSYVLYEDLALKYGGAHGIGGGNTHHIIVRNCDFSYIGGGDQRGGEHTVRFGNGVEFWGNAHDCLVEGCRLWEIYDAALTNQSSGPNTKQYNILYRNNVIWNSEYSFEYWNRPEVSETYNIRFEHNTCVNAGYGWGHTQRSDPSGRHLCFYSNPAQTRDFHVRNNIFYESKTHGLYMTGWPEASVAGLHLDHNCWYQEEGDLIRMGDTRYTAAQFAAYQAEQGKDAESIVAKPQFVDPANLDFQLTEGSPCIDAAAPTDRELDFDGAPVPHGAAPDIGAFEFSPN